MSYQTELAVAREVAQEAGQLLSRHYHEGTQSWKKATGDLVTIADLESDGMIRKHLSRTFPEDAVLSEEASDWQALYSQTSRAWIVDPMDGTKEFIQQIPEFAVSIALVENGEPVVGVIVNPVAEVQVWAERGQGTFRNSERVRISETSQLDRATVIASRNEIKQGAFREHESWFRELRPVGSIAWKLACIACGSADLTISFSPKNEWDVCAGDLLVREAGGIYKSFNGNIRRYKQRNPLIESHMAAGSTALVDAFLERERHASRGDNQ